jgi:hypothetical protein
LRLKPSLSAKPNSHSGKPDGKTDRHTEKPIISLVERKKERKKG